VLIKGPLILLFVGLTATTQCIADRSGGWLGALRPDGGILWFLLPVLPRPVAIFLRSGGEFFSASLGHDLPAESRADRRARRATRHLPVAVLTGLPAWPLAALAAVFGCLAWRRCGWDEAQRSLLRILAAALFLAGTATVLTDGAGAAEFLPGGGACWRWSKSSSSWTSGGAPKRSACASRPSRASKPSTTARDGGSPPSSCTVPQRSIEGSQRDGHRAAPLTPGPARRRVPLGYSRPC
jgi:hypothetical protein